MIHFETTDCITGKVFKFECDNEKIISELKLMRDAYAPDSFVPYLDMGENYLTDKEYNDNIDKFELKFTELLTIESIENLIAKATKKKNGYFHIGRMCYFYGCGNTEFFQEWHNTWSYYALKVKAISGDTLELFLGGETDTPG